MLKSFKYSELLIPFILCFITECFVEALTGLEKCRQIQWNERTVVKGTGSVVKTVATINAKSLKFTWYEAASCCRINNKMLASIANEKDLLGYHDALHGGETYYSLGWTNSYAFEDEKLRNLNGEYIDHGDKKICSPKIDPPKKGKCTGMFEESSGRITYYLLYLVDCSYVWAEKFFCEDTDPKQPPFNLDCFNLAPKTDWWTQNDWELILDKGRHCEGPGTPELPTPRPSPGLEKCRQIQWNERTVVKGTGSVVNAAATINAKALKFTWYEAASCCRMNNKTLASIANEKDLLGYHDALHGGETYYSLGWTNGYEFDDGKLRNLNGEYIDYGNKKICSPKIDPPKKGKCTGMFEESSGRITYYLLYLVDCSYVWAEKFFCEDPDPRQPPFNLDCFNFGPKTDWWTKEDWELVLDKGRYCEGTGTPWLRSGRKIYERLFGSFIPQSTFKPIRGVMMPGPNPFFIPNYRSDQITSPTKGTFLPLESNDLEFPFMTLYGEMEPHSVVFKSSAFIVDDTISGDFIADKGLITYTGRMTQDNFALFTPNGPPYIQEPTEGNWIPASGILPNHPCSTIHGTMRPKPAPAKDSLFTPDPIRHGIFTPDNDPQNPVPGKLSQTTLPKFTPDVKSFKFEKSISGTWKPYPLDNEASISHGIMKPTENEGTVFIPESVVFGKFNSDNDPANAIGGSMTISVPQIFTPHGYMDLSQPIHGKWIPNNGVGIRGTLRPTDYLPPNYLLFQPGGR